LEEAWGEVGGEVLGPQAEKITVDRTRKRRGSFFINNYTKLSGWRGGRFCDKNKNDAMEKNFRRVASNNVGIGSGRGESGGSRMVQQLLELPAKNNDQ